MITKYSIESLEAITLDHLQAGLTKDQVLEGLIQLGNSCLEKELYENMNEIKRIYYLVKKI